MFHVKHLLLPPGMFHVKHLPEGRPNREVPTSREILRERRIFEEDNERAAVVHDFAAHSQTHPFETLIRPPIRRPSRWFTDTQHPAEGQKPAGTLCRRGRGGKGAGGDEGERFAKGRIMPEILRPTLEYGHPAMDPEAGYGGPQPGGPLDLAVEQGRRNIRPQHCEHEARDSGATAQIQERRRVEGRCPGRGVIYVAFHRIRAQKPQPAGVFQHGAQGAEIGHAGRITT